MPWLIGGESGVGKSRLIDEVRIRALTLGALVLRGHGVIDGGLPYQLWRDPIRRLILTTEITDIDAGIFKEIVPDIHILLERDVADAPLMDAEEAQRRLIDAIRALFRRQDKPIVLVLDDLQWAIESLEPLKLLIEIATQLPLFIIGSYRDDETPDLPERLPGAQTLKLGRLDDDLIAELSVAMLGEDNGSDPKLITLLKRETEGNVLFIVEVLRALAVEAGGLDHISEITLPEHIFTGGIQKIVERHLSRIPDHARRLLDLAAVAGSQLDLAIIRKLIEKVTSLQDIELDTWLTLCANAAVLESQETIWRFSHVQLQETLVHDVAADQLPTLHRQVAEAIEAVYPDDVTQATALVQHWYQAGDISKEIHYVLIAGQELLFVGSYREALRICERTLERLPADDEHRFELLSIMGEAHFHLGEFSEASECYAQALELSRRQENEAGEAAALHGLGQISQRRSELDAAQAHYEGSLAIYFDIDEKPGIATTLRGLGLVAIDRSEFETARMYFAECLAVYLQLEDQRGIAVSYRGLGLAVSNQGNFVQARRYYEDSLAIYQRIGDRHGSAIMLNNLGVMAWYQGDLRGASDYFGQAKEIFAEIGDRRNYAFAINNQGAVADNQGEFDAARAYYEEALQIYRDINEPSGIARTLNNLGYVASMQQDITTARTHYEEALKIYRGIGERRNMAEVLSNLARVVYKDDQPTAQDWIKESLSIRRAINDQFGIAQSLDTMGLMAYEQKDFSTARTHTEESLSIFREIGDRLHIAEALSHLAFIHIALKDNDSARSCAQEGLHIAQDIAATPITMQALLAFARLRLVEGQAESSIELMGLVIAHPVDSGGEIRNWLNPLHVELITLYPIDQFQKVLDRGKLLDLEVVTKELLADFNLAAADDSASPVNATDKLNGETTGDNNEE